MKPLAALLMFLLLAASPAAAQTNPFTGAPAPSPAPAAQPAEPPGFFAQINREIARFQRDTTREMSQRMRAIRDGETPMALLVGLGLAFLYGVIHAAGPGHGKAVVVGYFLTRHAQIGRGLLMGLQISVGHVVSAIIIALGADLLFRTVWGTSAAEIRWIQLASYALIALIGAWMLVETARGRGHHHEHCTIPGHDHSHGGHSHGGHDHHAHEHRPQGWLSLGVGIVPCTGAILVMLYALANGILLAGFLLVAAIAAGMALTMAALGMLAIVARQAMTRWTSREEGGGWLGRVLEYAGAAVITLIGIFLFWSAY